MIERRTNIEQVSQLWCMPEHENKTMDVALAHDIVALLKAKDAEIENGRLQLAACGVAALQNTMTTVKDRITSDNPAWSASYGDVCDAVDREMEYWAENQILRTILSEALEFLETKHVVYKSGTDPLVKDLIIEAERRNAFGALMVEAERSWRQYLEEQGYPVGGEFAVGHCRTTVDNFLNKVRQVLRRVQR